MILQYVNNNINNKENDNKYMLTLTLTVKKMILQYVFLFTIVYFPMTREQLIDGKNEGFRRIIRFFIPFFFL